MFLIQDLKILVINEITESADTNMYGIFSSNSTEGTNILVKNVGINDFTMSQGAIGYCVGMKVGNNSSYINCVVNDIKATITGSNSSKVITLYGIWAVTSSNVQNCTIANLSGTDSNSQASSYVTVYGLVGSGSAVVENTLSMLNTSTGNGSATDFVSMGSGSDYNASEDTSSNGQGSNYVTNVTPSDEVVDTSVSTFDCHVKDTDSDIYDAGVDLGSDFTDDIDGETRTRWDIGADEYTEEVSDIGLALKFGGELK